MNRRSLVVNADDLGATRWVNDGIRRAYDDGILSSGSVMVVGDAIDDALECLRERPEMGRGIHVALTDGTPLSDASAIDSLVTDDGRFFQSGRRFYANWFRGRIDPEHVRLEATAQIERAIRQLDRVDHLNSHMHVHMIPRIFGIFHDLVESFDIPHLRVSHERLPRKRTAATAQYLVRTLLAPGIAKKAVLSGLSPFCRPRSRVLTESFSGVVHVGNMSERTLTGLLESNTCSPLEVCVHPGTAPERAVTRFDDLAGGRERDLSGLTSEVVGRIVDRRYELATFEALAGRRR